MRCIIIKKIDINRDSEIAAVGIGTMIIFIAMILVAGIAASIMLQTMNNLQSQALKTGKESINDVSSGVEITHISGYQINGKIDQLAIIITPIAGSSSIDLSTLIIRLTNNEKQIYCYFNENFFNDSINNGIFQTINTSLMNAIDFGVIVIRDRDSSCTNDNPIMTQNDLVLLMINTTKNFLGIPPHVDVSGSITPESGLSGQIRFTTPSSFVDAIIELQP
jgi:flagellin FlaB